MIIVPTLHIKIALDRYAVKIVHIIWFLRILINFQNYNKVIYP